MFYEYVTLHLTVENEFFSEMIHMKIYVEINRTIGTKRISIICQTKHPVESFSFLN